MIIAEIRKTPSKQKWKEKKHSIMSRSRFPVNHSKNSLGIIDSSVSEKAGSKVVVMGDNVLG